MGARGRGLSVAYPRVDLLGHRVDGMDGVDEPGAFIPYPWVNALEPPREGEAPADAVPMRGSMPHWGLRWLELWLERRLPTLRHTSGPEGGDGAVSWCLRQSRNTRRVEGGHTDAAVGRGVGLLVNAVSCDRLVGPDRACSSPSAGVFGLIRREDDDDGAEGAEQEDRGNGDDDPDLARLHRCSSSHVGRRAGLGGGITI